MNNLFGFPESEPKVPKVALFCKKWTLQQAMAKLLDIKFQDDKKFPLLISELYAYSIVNESKELFAFLEARFNANVIQDKEVHLHFEVVGSREDANA